jgi:DNA helicase HerA-like ATPase
MNDRLRPFPAIAASDDAAALSTAIGKVASPPHRESTSEVFFFWVAPGVLVEKSQIVRTESDVGGRKLTFFGLITEVYRQSRLSNLGEEFDRYDGVVSYQPPFDSPGFTFAAVSILRTDPAVLAPPLEGSDVFLGGEAEARMAYSADEIEDPLAVGLIKNGGSMFAGPGRIDLDYLLGANGGHLNVNGVAGRGTKSSFLLHVNYLLLREARRRQKAAPSDPNRLRVVPIILNVKNFDLFHIDRRSVRYDAAQHAAEWKELGINDPAPFTQVRYLAPQQRGLDVPLDTGRPKADVQAYSWSLRDLVERGLFAYLFAEDDRHDANFAALVYDMEGWLTDEKTERDGTRSRQLSRAPGRPQTFDALLGEIRSWTESGGALPFSSKQHHVGTVRKLYRRLFLVLSEGHGVLRRTEQNGRPLTVTARDTCDPTVVDLSSLAAVPSLQRFVAATIFNQLKEERTGSRALRGLIYLVTLDELNRFAPHGAHDPITQLIEHVAAEMRSQGIILLGAQQQASLVSSRVIENAGVHALGKSGSVEMNQRAWRFLSESARRKAATLSKEEKLIVQDSFREPMLVKVPFPPWALRGAEAVDDAPAPSAATGFDDP